MKKSVIRIALFFMSLGLLFAYAFIAGMVSGCTVKHYQYRCTDAQYAKVKSDTEWCSTHVSYFSASETCYAEAHRRNCDMEEVK